MAFPKVPFPLITEMDSETPQRAVTETATGTPQAALATDTEIRLLELEMVMETPRAAD